MKLIKGNALTVLPTLEDGSVAADLVKCRFPKESSKISLTSTPYKYWTLDKRFIDQPYFVYYGRNGK